MGSILSDAHTEAGHNVRVATGRMRGAGLGLAVILANILLVAVVVVLMTRGDGAPGSDDANQAGETSAATPITPGDESTATAAPSTGTAAPSPGTETATPTSEEPEPGPTLAERYADGEDLTVVVLGDRTGTDPADWALTWARQLAAERVVEVHTPSPADGTVYLDPEVLGQGEATISFYNASRVGGTPVYAAERVELLVPRNADLVLVNYGRSNDETDIARELGRLRSALELHRPDTEVRVIIQPPRQDGLPSLVEITRTWAEAARVETIDVAEVFEEEGILQLTVSTRDPLSVNLFGADRWAQIVHEAVFDGSSG